MIKGIIFDLDGVICSTDVYHFEAWKQTMKKLGVDIDQNTMDKLRGAGRVEGFKMMLLKNVFIRETLDGLCRFKVVL